MTTTSSSLRKGPVELGLYLTDRSPSGLEVSQRGEANAEVSFSHKIMARRSGIKVGRLERIGLPDEAGIAAAPSDSLWLTLLPFMISSSRKLRQLRNPGVRSSMGLLLLSRRGREDRGRRAGPSRRLR
jgi:hypothetical protein